MSESKSSSSSGGISFVGLLTIVFITLKLTGFIEWSWWWVLSPVFIVCSFVVTVALGLGIAWLIVFKYENKARRD